MTEAEQLVEHIQRLNFDLADEIRVREKLADLLKRIAVVLKGPEPPGVMWDWSDLPQRTEALQSELYRLKAEIEQLKDREL